MAQHDTENTAIKGNVRLVVNAEGLEAVLFFERQENGKEWTAGDIASYITEKAVEGVGPEKITSAIDFFSASSTRSVSFVVATGRAPVPPVCDVPEWHDFPIPPELGYISDDVLRGAQEPQITVEHVEKVKRAKTVQKKTQFPFAAGKEEKTFVYETVKKHVRVEIDPHICATGFVRKGSVIALLGPGEPGSQGRDVYGTLVPAPKKAVPAVFPGPGVKKVGEELHAVTTGFLRRGTNWVDVVAFEHHTWSLEFSKDRATCFLSFIPGKISGGLPKAEDITAEALKREYPVEALISDEELDSMLVDSFRKGEPLERILISRDADAEMRIEETEIDARLYVRKGRGRGKALLLSDLGKLIKNSRLKGIDLEIIRRDILNFFHGPQLELTGYTLVAGIPPGRGEDRTLTFMFEAMSETDARGYRERLSSRSPVESGVTSLDEFPPAAVQTFAIVKKGLQVAVLSPAVKGESGKDIHGKIVPGLPGNDPDIRLFENLKFEKDSIVAESDGILEKSELNGSVFLRIRKYRDANITITISDDRMKVFLSIDVPEGSGMRATGDAVRRLIGENGITTGMSEDAIADAVLRHNAGETVKNVLIAQGISPRHGMENRIQFKVDLHENEGVTIRTNGSADFKNRNNITQIRQGELIAEVFPPDISPEDGRDVTGRVIPARSAPPLRLQIGKNIRQEDAGEGRMRLFAGVTGELVYAKGLLDIRNIHVVPGDVDYKSGNIRFPGTVLVKGSVLSGFHIFSGEDIIVEQVVQSSLLSADGNVLVKLGVKGGGKGVIRTKKNFNSGFVELAVLLSVGDVRIEKSCIHTRIRCNGEILLPQEKSTIIGGSIKTRKGLSVFNLGTENNIRTEVSFGQDYLIADQIETEEKEIEKLKIQIVQLDHAMHKIEKEGDRSALDTIRKEKIGLLKAIEKRNFRLFTLREKFEEHFPSRITVRGTIFPGVVFESHGRTYEIRSEKRGIAISFDPQSGRIIELPVSEIRRR